MISTFNSLTLSPALCALLLKGPRPADYRPSLVGRVVGFVFFPLTFLGRLFNRGFGAANRGYVKLVGFGLRVPLLVLCGYAADRRVGRGRVPHAAHRVHPAAGQGLPDLQRAAPRRASAERTREVMSKISRIALETEIDDGTGKKVRPVAHVNAVAGQLVRPQRVRLELRLDVHHPRRVREPPVDRR